MYGGIKKKYFEMWSIDEARVYFHFFTSYDSIVLGKQVNCSLCQIRYNISYLKVQRKYSRA